VPLLTATNLDHAFGQRIILEGVSLTVEPGDRIGVVGRNGQGKTTLLRALGGAIEPDGGAVSLSRGARVGYLTQDPELDPEQTLRDEAEMGFAELHALHQQMHGVFHEMESASGERLERLMAQQARLESQIEAMGGYAIDHRIDATLHGLGLPDELFKVKVGDLSGGQKGRLALARLLLAEPDVLLLDEPTNHLDLAGRIWLEEFLTGQFRGAVVMISHDRYLLDRVVTRIVEVEETRLYDYPGNYSAFREIRAQRRLTQMRAYENQQTRFKQEEAYIRRYKAGQRARQAQGRLAKLERAKQETIERPVEMSEAAFNLPRSERSGDVVVTARGISKSYTDAATGKAKVLFKDLDLSISRGERWGIIGPNGAGKSTLVRILLGEQEPDAGIVRPGSNLRVGYYRQSHGHLPPDMPVYVYLQKVIARENPGVQYSEQQARNLAGAFLFSGSEQEAVLGRLSGGERSRATMAGLLASGKNLLVLDEPTNHLDIPSAERLEDVLALPIPPSSESEGVEGGEYEHTLVVISHDRAFIDATCDHLVVLDGEGGAEVVVGNYTDWHERQAQRKAERARAEAEEKRRREEAERRRREPARPVERSASRNALERLKTEQLEEKIQRIEGRIKEIDRETLAPDAWRDAARCARLGAERTALMAELEPLEFEWLRRAEEP